MNSDTATLAQLLKSNNVWWDFALTLDKLELFDLSSEIEDTLHIIEFIRAHGAK